MPAGSLEGMDTSLHSTTPDRLPDWLAEALDVLSARRRLVVAAAVGLVLFGAIVALVAPSILPPRPVVGAAVGVAAALLSTALALALDASDLVVRGARHVRAAGGTVDVRVGRQHDDVGPLLAAVARHAGTGPLRVALAPASRSAGVPGARAAALAEALARTGRKVLLTDLTRGGSPAAGLSDVITGTRTLSEVVRFEQELYLARLAVGSDPDVAIRGLAGWVEGVPSDLEVLVAALPPLAEPGVLAASASLDATLVLVEVDRTERVDLIASLDAVDAADLTCEVVLVDPERTAALSSPPAADAEPAEVDDDQPADDVDEAVSEPVFDVAEPVSEPVSGADLQADAVDERAGDDLAQPDPRPDPAPAMESPFAPPADVEPAVDTPDAPTSVPGAGAPTQATGSTADATAEIVMPGSGWPAAPDEPATPGDEPAQDHESTQDDAPAAEDPLAGIWDDDAAERHPTPPAQPWIAPRADASPSVEAPSDAAGAPAGAPAHTPRAPAPTTTPAPEPGPEPAPEPTPDPTPERDPQPTGGPRPEPNAEEPLDDAALQAARTSAALQQLAQQIWERDER